MLDDARHGELACACFDRVTGALWVGASRGAVALVPGETRWRRLKLDGKPVVACAPGARGVWLAGAELLFAPDPRGAGVARHRLKEAVGHDAAVAGMAADRGGLWIAVRGLSTPVPSLLRLPHDPPVFQRYHAMLSREPGDIEAIAGDGERAWALGSGWITELEERSVARPDDPFAALLAKAPSVPPAQPAPPPGDPGQELVDTVTALFDRRWLRAHKQGLVGRNGNGLFCAGHAPGQLLCPRLPGRIDAIATDWLGVRGGMLVGTAAGAWYVDPAGTLRCVLPHEEIVALLPGPATVVVTRRRVLAVEDADLAAAPVTSVDLHALALTLARARLCDRSAAARAAALRALQSVGDAADVDAVAARLDDDDLTVRAVACDAVARLAPAARARELLVRAMSDPATNVQAAAVRAIRAASGA